MYNFNIKVLKIFVVLVVISFVWIAVAIKAQSSNMAEPTWGALEKSAVDNETIEQAIARLIQAHDDDAQAHDDPAQSLYVHKDQDHLDHVVGSVVADKFSFTEGIIQSNFESLDSWTTTGVVSLDELLGSALYLEWGVTNLSRLYGVVKWQGNYLNYSKDMMFQTSFWLDYTANTIANALLGWYVNDTNIQGFGFQIINGTVKGFWGDGASPTFTADLVITATTPHVYRAQYNATDQNVKFYVDGTLKATIANISPVGNIEPMVYYRWEATGVGDGEMHVKDLTIAREA